MRADGTYCPCDAPECDGVNHPPFSGGANHEPKPVDLCGCGRAKHTSLGCGVPIPRKNQSRPQPLRGTLTMHMAESGDGRE